MKISRNDLCPCGSGKKYKKCCMSADESASPEFIWRKIRQAEADLLIPLIEYAVDRFGNEILQYASDMFWVEEEFAQYASDLPDMKFVFSLWAVFNCDVMDFIEETEWALEILKLEEVSIARLYLEEHDEKLNPFQRRYIQEIISRPYSFFQVMDVSAGKTLTLRDLFLNQTHVVIEKQASRPEIKGAILFTRVISMDGVSVMTGCMAFPIPPHYQASFIDFRNEMKEIAKNPVTPELLMEYEFELRERFFEIVAEAQNPKLPELHNTDGDPLAPVKLKYHLNCSPTEAFDCLKSLAAGVDDTKLLMDTDLNPAGELKRIHFSWLKKGNAKNPGWENTVMGTIKINGNQMNIEVNSVNRAETIKKEIKKRLGKRAAYQTSVITSIPKMMEKSRESGTATLSPKERTDHDKLMQIPEVKAKITEMAKKHWDSWVDIALPALGNLTPREATKDPVGREKLDGIFLHFESMNRSHGINEFSPDIVNLKKILGI